MGFVTIPLVKFLSRLRTTLSAFSAPTASTHQQNPQESRLNLVSTTPTWQGRFLSQLGSISNTRTHTLIHTSIPIPIPIPILILILILILIRTHKPMFILTHNSNLFLLWVLHPRHGRGKSIWLKILIKAGGGI
jgi:hypothetical protein